MVDSQATTRQSVPMFHRLWFFWLALTSAHSALYFLKDLGGAASQSVLSPLQDLIGLFVPLGLLGLIHLALNVEPWYWLWLGPTLVIAIIFGLNLILNRLTDNSRASHIGWNVAILFFLTMVVDLFIYHRLLSLMILLNAASKY